MAGRDPDLDRILWPLVRSGYRDPVLIARITETLRGLTAVTRQDASRQAPRL